jgi:hypothetical protein
MPLRAIMCLLVVRMEWGWRMKAFQESLVRDWRMQLMQRMRLMKEAGTREAGTWAVQHMETWGSRNGYNNAVSFAERP